MKKTLVILLILTSFLGQTQTRESIQKGFFKAIVNDSVFPTRTTERKANDDGFNYAVKHKIKSYKIVPYDYVEVSIEYPPSEKDTVYIEKEPVIIRDTVLLPQDTLFVKNDGSWIYTKAYFGQPIVTEHPILRINVGGETVKDSLRDWRAVNEDERVFEAGSMAYSHTTEIKRGNIPSYMTDTIMRQLFKTEKWSAKTDSLYYTFKIPNGNYYVNLYVMPEYFTTRLPKTRVFDVLIDDKIVYADFDPNSMFGTLTAGMLVLVVRVENEELKLSFNHKIDNPLINAIEIIEKR